MTSEPEKTVEEETIDLDKAFVEEDKRVLDPSLLDKSVLERMPQPTGWRMLVLPYKGKGVSEKGFDSNGKCIIECKAKYFRPLEVDSLLGDSKKAQNILKWKPKYNIYNLVSEMVDEDLKSLIKD